MMTTKQIPVGMLYRVVYCTMPNSHEEHHYCVAITLVMCFSGDAKACVYVCVCISSTDTQQ